MVYEQDRCQIMKESFLRPVKCLLLFLWKHASLLEIFRMEHRAARSCRKILVGIVAYTYLSALCFVIVVMISDIRRFAGVYLVYLIQFYYRCSV
jgi:hypothetical protein